MTEDLEGGEARAEFEAVKLAIAENWGWFLALGITLLVLGTAAILFPLLATVATKILLGWVLLLAGIVHVLLAFGAGGWKGVVGNVLLGLLYLGAGVWLAFFPLAGIVTLTVLLALVFICEGILEIFVAFRLRPETGWGLVLFSGIVALLVGAMIWAKLPSSAAWAIGLLAGINLLISGWSFVWLALAGRKAGEAEAPG